MGPFEPMDLTVLVSVVMGTLMFLIPIAAFSVRFTIKPIVEALAKAREGNNDREMLQLLERRMALLEQEVHGVSELRADLVRVLDEMEFQKKLGQPK
jgi:hypothetical protein